MTALLQEPQYLDHVLLSLELQELSDAWCKETMTALKKKWQQEEGTFDITNWIEELSDEELKLQLRSMALENLDEDIDVKVMIDDCLLKLSKRSLSSKLENLNEEIRIAEREGDETKLFKLLAAKQKLSQEIRS